MKLGTLVMLCVLAFPASALAKGPSGATISGPGLEQPLELGGPTAWRRGSPMEALTSTGGFFQVAWGGSPGRILAESPTKQLGPRYRVVYVVPGPSGAEDLIRQDLYPFARGGPLTHTAAGQPFFGTRRTQGGWFRAAPRLKRVLVAAGLPTPSARGAAPAAAAESSTAPPLALWALVGTLALVAVTAVALRRRARAASA